VYRETFSQGRARSDRQLHAIVSPHERKRLTRAPPGPPGPNSASWRSLGIDARAYYRTLTLCLYSVSCEKGRLFRLPADEMIVAS